jgi:hypothetical protein
VPVLAAAAVHGDEYEGGLELTDPRDEGVVGIEHGHVVAERVEGVRRPAAGAQADLPLQAAPAVCDDHPHRF